MAHSWPPPGASTTADAHVFFRHRRCISKVAITGLLLPAGIKSAALASSCCGIDQSENIVEDEVASLAIREELEGLGVAHGLLFIVDLKKNAIPSIQLRLRLVVCL